MNPALSIRNLTFAYPGGPTVIDIPALDLARGEQLLLTAGSGAGKSTLLHLIAGLMDPTTGTIAVDSQPIHALHGARRDLFRGRHIGMIFQTFNLLLGFSALENVMAALMFSSIKHAEHRPRTASLLTRLGIERQDARPNELSVGQQQRIAVARAIACNPALVLADEPTASLDPENSAGAMELIQSLCRETGAASLCVSHDPAMKDRFQKRSSLAELRAMAATSGGGSLTMAMTDFTIIRRSMSSRMFSTVTTIITVAVAVALMLVLLGMRKAARESFTRGAGNPHLIISAEPDPMSVVLNTIFYSRLPQQYLMVDRFERLTSGLPIKDDSGKLVSGYAIPVAQGDSYRGFPVLATTPEFLTAFQPQAGYPWKFTHGAPFTGDLQIVLGASAARQSGLKMGDKLVLTHGTSDSRGGTPAHEHDEFKFEVVGILAPSGTAHDRALIISLQSSWIVHAQDRLEKEHSAGDHHDHAGDHDHEHIATAADLTAADKKITAALIRLASTTDTSTPTVLQQIASMLKREPGLTVAQPGNEITKLFGIVSNIDQVLLAMAAVVMVSSGIAIMLALYNSMEQRRRQIAVLRVLGCSRPRIFSLILTESALLGALGAFAGVLIAGLGQNLVAAIMKQRLGLVIEPALATDLVLGIIVASVLLASLAGLIPAIMAYRTPVATNLKPAA